MEENVSEPKLQEKTKCKNGILEELIGTPIIFINQRGEVITGKLRAVEESIFSLENPKILKSYRINEYLTCEHSIEKSILDKEPLGVYSKISISQLYSLKSKSSPNQKLS